MKVVLVSAPLTLEERYGGFAVAGSTQPTATLAYLGAIVKRDNHDIIVIDASAIGLGVDEVASQVINYKPDILAVTTTTIGITSSARLCEIIKEKKPDVITVIGGCHVTAIPKETLREYKSFDVVVVGEGEETLSQLLTSIESTGLVPENLAGTAVRVGTELSLNPARPLLKNLDELPLPAWDLLPGFPKAFKPSPARIKRFPCASVVFTRGCPYQCTFCDRSVFGNKVRSYSTDYTIKMLKDLRYNYGVKEVLIEDDTFIITTGRMEEFCKRLISEKIDVSWSCLGRADRVNPEILALMKKAGCWHIAYGVESGDPEILKRVNKRESIIDIRNAVKWSKEAHLKTKGFFMVGFPGETEQSLALTRKLVCELPLDDISVMQLTPFPGSAIYNDAHKYGFFDRNWRKMNVLTTVFVPNGFSKDDMEKARIDLLKAFYFRPGVVFSKILDIFMNPILLIPMLKGLIALLRVTVFNLNPDCAFKKCKNDK